MLYIGMLNKVKRRQEEEVHDYLTNQWTFTAQGTNSQLSVE
jgi:hypothetical protein